MESPLSSVSSETKNEPAGPSGGIPVQEGRFHDAVIREVRVMVDEMRVEMREMFDEKMAPWASVPDSIKKLEEGMDEIRNEMADAKKTSKKEFRKLSERITKVETQSLFMSQIANFRPPAGQAMQSAPFSFSDVNEKEKSSPYY